MLSPQSQLPAQHGWKRGGEHGCLGGPCPYCSWGGAFLTSNLKPGQRQGTDVGAGTGTGSVKGLRCVSGCREEPAKLGN